jgi:hypothetical protein
VHTLTDSRALGCRYVLYVYRDITGWNYLNITPLAVDAEETLMSIVKRL